MDKNSSKWLEVRKVLSKCSERDLIGLVADLYALSQSNKDFLDARFIKNDKVLSRYKNLIKKYISPSEPWKNSQQISLKDAKKAISDYKKATNDTIGLIDLMVCYVEYGTDFLCEFGDRNSLKVGDRVGWYSRLGYDLYGVVEKLNPKKALVRLGNGEQWTVSYSLLFLVLDGVSVQGGQLCIEGEVVA